MNYPDQAICGKCGKYCAPGKAILRWFGHGGRIHKDPAECEKPAKPKKQLSIGLRTYQEAKRANRQTENGRSDQFVE